VTAKISRARHLAQPKADGLYANKVLLKVRRWRGEWRFIIKIPSSAEQAQAKGGCGHLWLSRLLLVVKMEPPVFLYDHNDFYVNSSWKFFGIGCAFFFS